VLGSCFYVLTQHYSCSCFFYFSTFYFIFFYF